MRIAHLTDLHIGTEEERPYDVDVRSRFAAVLEDIRRHPVDLMVLTGDLCYRDGYESIYRWIRDRLTAQDTPYLILPGNHDDPAILADVFDLDAEMKAGKLYYEREFEGVPVLFLDTADNTLSAEQRDFLGSRLQDPTLKRLVVFMHHPPVRAGVYYMDLKYPLLNHEEIGAMLLAALPDVTVFCGHYHVEKTIRHDGLNVFVSPSTFVQIDQEAHRFEVDHRDFGWRRIWLDAVSLMTSVRYLREDV